MAVLPRDLGSIFSPVINDLPTEKAVEVAADAAPAIAAVFNPASITGAAAPPVATVAIAPTAIAPTPIPILIKLDLFSSTKLPTALIVFFASCLTVLKPSTAFLYVFDANSFTDLEKLVVASFKRLVPSFLKSLAACLIVFLPDNTSKKLSLVLFAKAHSLLKNDGLTYFSLGFGFGISVYDEPPS